MAAVELPDGLSMFESLSENLQSTLKNLRGQGRLTEDNIADALRAAAGPDAVATSEADTFAYTRDLCWDLLDAAALLFTDAKPDERDRGELEAMKEISLDDHEIIDLAAADTLESKP